MGKCCSKSSPKTEEIKEPSLTKFEEAKQNEPDKKPRKTRNEEISLEGLTGEECPICLENYSNQKPVKKLFCGHYFCRNCIDKVIEIHPFCPLCNTFSVLVFRLARVYSASYKSVLEAVI